MIVIGTRASLASGLVFVGLVQVVVQVLKPALISSFAQTKKASVAAGFLSGP